jgi:ATP-dependent Zn protease
MTTDPETGLAIEERPPEMSPAGEPRPSHQAEERTTRKPMAWWDRIKFLLLGVVLLAFLVWNTYVENQGVSAISGESVGISLRNALQQAIRANIWLLVLLALEALRQIHYLICEHSAAYYGFFSEKVFGGINRRTGKMNAWNRYRIARAVKWVAFLAILSFVLGKIFGVSAFTALFTLPARIIAALPMLFQLFIYVGILLLQFVALFYFLSRGGVDVYFPDDVKTRFDDVWGQDAVLNRVKENMVFLENPDAIEAKGGYVPGGILLWGPPGTGKTLMAEAVAGETGKPFVFVDPGAFINMFMGVGILKVKSLFRKLRKIALKYGGVIAFFDEADALGNRGQLMPPGSWGGQMTPAPWKTTSSCNGMAWLDEGTQSFLMRETMQRTPSPDAGGRNHIIAGMGGMGGGGMGTLQALLSEIQGLSKPRGFFNRKIRRMLGMRPKPPPKYRILIMMATNMPQALDEALLRPGRIDRIYKVGYPSKVGRVRTYQGYFDKVPHELTAEQIDKLATITPYATGATIKDVVNESLINAFRDGREVINWENVIKAKQLKDLGPPEDVEYIERERHSVAVHEACHAVVAYRVRHHLTIDIATIEKGGTYLGMVASIPPEDQFTRWRSEYEADVMVSLASLAGERLFFDGDSSSGCSGDLETATRLATFMEGYWGMGTTIASHGVTHEVGIGGGGKPGGGGPEKKEDLLEGSLGERIETNLDDLYQRTEAMLRDNRAQILSVAHALEANKTVTGDDVTAVIERRRGPILDGTPYASEEFAASLEAYHDAAVAAHKGHANVRIPMPKTTVPFQPAPPGSNGGSPNGHVEPPEPAGEAGEAGEAGQAGERPNGDHPQGDSGEPPVGHELFPGDDPDGGDGGHAPAPPRPDVD